MVYDCFTFFNELDLLEIRLNTLDKVVDRFVLVESDRTFTNKPKPCVFEENKARFSRFLPRIIYVKVTEFPAYRRAWDYESVQRNAIALGLVGASDEDDILISDVDEIPDPQAIRKWAGTRGIKRFNQRYYSFYLNFRNVRQAYWWGTRMLSYRDFKTCFDGSYVRYDEFLPREYNVGTTASKIRCRRPPFWKVRTKVIWNGGWHFTCLGGAEAVLNKLSSYSHEEHDPTARKLTVEAVAEMISQGRSPGLKMNCFADSFDQSFPEFILANRGRYSALICAEGVGVRSATRFVRTVQGILIAAFEWTIPAHVHSWLHCCRVWVRNMMGDK